MKSMYDDFEADDKKKKAPQAPAPAPKPTTSKGDKQDLEKLKADVRVLSEKDETAAPKSAPPPSPKPAPKAPKPAPKAPEPAADTDVYGDPPTKGSKALGLINLLLLLVVIAFQVRIILWQQGINRSVKELEDEVNKEKVERVELGNKLLEQIEKIEARPAGGAAAGVSVYKVSTKLTLRSSASRKGRKITTVARNAYVSALGDKGNWQKVKYGTKTGWLSKKYLAPVATVKVTNKTLNVRSKASTHGRKVLKLKRGDTATVLGYAKGWFNIQAKGKKGWVSKKYVKPVK